MKIKILIALLMMLMLQGCVGRIMDTQDRQNYSAYLVEVDKTNLEREKAGLPPDEPKTFKEWKGK